MCRNDINPAYRHLRASGRGLGKVPCSILILVVVVVVILLSALHQVNGRSSKHQDNSDTSPNPEDDLEEAWHLQIEQAEKSGNCEPRFQFLILNDTGASDQHGVPVRRCPQDCSRVCKYASYRCMPVKSRQVTRVARFREHTYDHYFNEYRKVTVEEDVECSCEKV